jgi:DNA-binding HxlR family transcriptional regulator
LLILSFLLRANKAHRFTDLRNSLHLTDGTLSVHLSKLEDGGLVSIEKTFEGKKPLVADLKGIVPGLGGGT